MPSPVVRRRPTYPRRRRHHQDLRRAWFAAQHDGPSNFESGDAKFGSPGSRDVQRSATNGAVRLHPTASWNGPACDVTNVMFNGSTHKGRFRLAASAGSSTAQLRMDLQRDAGSITNLVNNAPGDHLFTAYQWRFATPSALQVARPEVWRFPAAGIPSVALLPDPAALAAGNSPAGFARPCAEMSGMRCRAPHLQLLERRRARVAFAKSRHEDAWVWQSGAWIFPGQQWRRLPVDS